MKNSAIKLLTDDLATLIALFEASGYYQITHNKNGSITIRERKEPALPTHLKETYRSNLLYLLELGFCTLEIREQNSSGKAIDEFIVTPATMTQDLKHAHRDYKHVATDQKKKSNVKRKMSPAQVPLSPPLVAPPSVQQLQALYHQSTNAQEKITLILANWQYLSIDMHRYIFQCIELNLIKKVKDESLVAEEFQSSLTCDLARIPVITPSDPTQQLYDLTDLLKLPLQYERGHPIINERLDPVNNCNFSFAMISFPVNILNRLKSEMVRLTAFPIHAEFTDEKFPAKFEFTTRQHAENAMKAIANTGQNQTIEIEDSKDGKIWLKFNAANCQNDLVKQFLNLYVYRNDEAKRAASYLAYRAKNTNRYYKDPGCFGFIYRVFAETRENRCNNAFNRISGFKTLRTAQQQSMLTDPIQHYNRI